MLEGAGCDEMETELGEAGLESFWIRDGDLEFDLRVLHGWSIRLTRCKTRTLLCFCGFFQAVADGEAKAFGFGHGAENDRYSAGVQFTKSGEESLGEGGEVFDGIPGEYF